MKQTFKKIKKLLQAKPLGFNIIEILIMISLLALAFVAIMSLIGKNIQLEYIIKNDFIAVGLAQEGLELVEQVRNDNIKADKQFYTEIVCNAPPHDPPENGDTCTFAIDYLGTLQRMPTTSQTILKFTNTEFYQHFGGADSQYKRVITTIYRDAGLPVKPFIEVTSDVSWDYKGQTYTYSLKSLLFSEI